MGDKPVFWKFDYMGKTYASWGEPRTLPKESVTNLVADYGVQVYDGRPIGPDDKMVMLMQGDSTLGLGDSIWLLSYMRDLYRLKSRRRAQFTFVSSTWINQFYSNFLPSTFDLREEFMERREFDTYQHKLPAMYYWKDMNDGADRSWVDNRSLVERLYNWTGMQYTGLPDFGEFTNEKILYPQRSFYQELGLDPKDKYVFFQWHSSGHTKNLPPRANVELIMHIIKKYGLKVYVVGRLKSLDMLNSIPGVVNLSGRTEGTPETLFSLAFHSEFIVCPDSAGVHMSEAYRIPSVCLMSTLPPVYICSKYRIPAFMYGSAHCPYRPCGIVHALPKQTKCPADTGEYCRVFNKIDLDLFDRCVEQSFKNRRNYRREDPIPFYDAMNQPISLEMV